MRYFLKKQIHSNCASVSSSDAFVTKEVDKEVFDKLAGEREITVSETYGFSVIYMDADKHYYNLGLKQGLGFHADKAEFDARVERICLEQGYERNNAFLDEMQSKQWKDNDDEHLQKRITEGYVIPAWHENLQLIDYKGGLSDEVFNDSDLQGYLRDGGCHGYIGHSVRKPELDVYIEHAFLAKTDNNIPLFSAWLSSKDGRHYGDYLEGSTFNEQKQIVDESIGNQIAYTKRWFGK